MEPFFQLVIKMIKKCLFPAAGYGTRFLPATKSMPKEMMPVVNKPLIEYGVEEAIEAGHGWHVYCHWSWQALAYGSLR